MEKIRESSEVLSVIFDIFTELYISDVVNQFCFCRKTAKSLSFEENLYSFGAAVFLKKSLLKSFELISCSRPDYLPPSIPADLADMVIKNHGDPPAWWVGQLVNYLMRPHPNLKTQLKVTEKRYGLGTGLSDPIVGVQIRRTDKVKNEAKLYSVDEYMSQVGLR